MYVDGLLVNFNELFKTDIEIVAYSSVEDCVEKAKWLMENPMKRFEIVVDGQVRCLNEHTFGD